MLLRNMIRPLERCLGMRLGGGDMLMWQTELKPHATGDFSIAVVQANHSLEDQGQVVTLPSATFVGVYDGHGGPEASRFVSSRLFPHLHNLDSMTSLGCWWLDMQSTTPEAPEEFTVQEDG